MATIEIMNRFINRIVSHSSRSIVSREKFQKQILDKELIWFGEFHSEKRIVGFQNSLLVACSSLPSQRHKKLHVVMEHFSFEMQDILDQFILDPNFGFDELKNAYREIGTEGHDLEPYKGFLMYCKCKTSAEGIESDEIQDQVFKNIQIQSSTTDIQLHGGFIPRPMASCWNKAESAEEKNKLLEEYYKKDFLPPPSNPMNKALLADSDRYLFEGSSSHFQLIKSMMSGEDIYSREDNDVQFPNEEGEEIGGDSTPIQRLHQAQLLKDHAMAYHIGKLMMKYNGDQFIIIAGFGHLKHYLGVPERLEAYLKAQTLHSNSTHGRKLGMNALMRSIKSSSMVGCQMLYETYLEDRYEPLKQAMNSEEDDEEGEEDNEGEDDEEEEENDEDEDEDDNAKVKALNNLFLNQPKLFDKLILESDIIKGSLFNFSEGRGKFLKPSCDYCFVYDEDDDNILSCPAGRLVKVETQDAYNSVGVTAKKRGNVKKAKLIMKHLQYTEEEMELIGDDYIYNFQGVANPHRVAKILPGEFVLDVGSGLGIDSLLASKSATETGRVLGVDLAPTQVAHANTMAKSKDLKNVSFIQGDAEKLSSALKRCGTPDVQFDVCISNGAFCLVPRKKQAFQEVFDALKPGGRMAISTTAIQHTLKEDIEWPVCIKMFANIDELKPMCEEVGFDDVQIRDAESPMEMEIPENIFEGDNPKRFKIHGKYADQYDFLEKMDMDELCKTVTIFGVKPSS